METKQIALTRITEAIAYLVSGTFVIEKMAHDLYSSSTTHLNVGLDWLVIGLGGLSILMSFLYVLSAIPKPINIVNRFIEKTHDYMLIILFPITLPQIIPSLLDFSNADIPKGFGNTISVIGLVFLVGVIIVLLWHFWKIISSKKQGVVSLVVLSISMIFNTIIRIYQGVSRTETVSFCVIVLILLLVTLFKLTQKESSERKENEG